MISATVKNNVVYAQFGSVDEQIKHFERDLVDLFTFQRQGHMERWEYWNADFENDPAGGAEFWDALIKRPSAYYLPRADMAMLGSVIKLPVVQLMLRGIQTVVELGPGSPESISGKTIPWLQYADKYVAVDQSESHAIQAGRLVKAQLGIPTEPLVCDYLHTNLAETDYGRKGFLMWGGAIGNIEGTAGADPLPEFLHSLELLAASCNSGDTVFIGIDTENRRERLMDAYNVPLLSRKFLSILFAAKKFGLILGDFTPENWTHRSLWHEDSQQCAHYLTAGTDQNFVIGGQRIRIPAGKSIITNNSYKFAPLVAQETARAAGFSRVYVSDTRPIALLMATK